MNPIFDGHVHLIGEHPDGYIAALLDTMDRGGVTRAVIFGMPDASDDHVAGVHTLHPKRFLSFASDFNVNAPDLGQQVSTRLENPRWRGLGEILPRHPVSQHALPTAQR